MNAHDTPDTFEKAFSLENLLGAHARAKRGKQKREEVARFGWNLEANLLALRAQLLGGTYTHGAYRKFIVSDSKRREIKSAPFRDRVVHQAIVAALEPAFEQRFVFDSYACRRGKGTHAALARFEQYLRVSRYALTMDISKYFASIDHSILLSLVARKVRETRLLALCRLIIESSEEAPGRGIPIGNLTSQLFANVYLNELDQYAKHGLRLRRYIRYMDDMVVLHDDKTFLHETKEKMREFAEVRLGLTMHPRKVQIAPVLPGVDFLGYRVFPHHRLLRKSTVKRFIARMKHAKVRGGGALRRNPSWRGLGTLGRALRAGFYSRFRAACRTRASRMYPMNNYQLVITPRI